MSLLGTVERCERDVSLLTECHHTQGAQKRTVFQKGVCRADQRSVLIAENHLCWAQRLCKGPEAVGSE